MDKDTSICEVESQDELDHARERHLALAQHANEEVSRCYAVLAEACESSAISTLDYMLRYARRAAANEEAAIHCEQHHRMLDTAALSETLTALETKRVPPIADDAPCTCGHDAYWHGYQGHGPCEHDGECGCAAFYSRT